MTEQPIMIDEAVQRYIAALDEIQYCAEQLAARTGTSIEYNEAFAALEDLYARAANLPMDVESIMRDAEGDVFEDPEKEEE